VTAARSALTAIGAAFLINDASLLPLYEGLSKLSVWLFHRSARAYGKLVLSFL
jgi:hypothetical protein